MAIFLQTIYDEARRQTRTNSNTLVNASLLTLTIDAKLDVERALAINTLEVNGVVAYTDLVLGQSDYAIPNDCFMVVHAEINYDDPTDYTKWIKMTPADLPNLPVVWQQFVQNNPETQAIFDMFGGQIYMGPQPIANAAKGLRLWYIQKQPDFVGTTPATEPVAWPFNLYWQSIAYAVAMKFWEPLDTAQFQRCQALFNTAIGDMVAGLSLENDEPIKTKVSDPYQYGWM